jgi:hypothetical protein
VIRLIPRAGLAFLALTVSGCALTLDSSELGVPASMAEPAQTPPQGTPFTVTRHPVYLLWGAVGVGRPSAEDVLAGQVGTGSRIANLRIKVRSRWSDVLVTALTLGVIVPRSVTLEGIVVPATGAGAPPAP